MNRLMLPLLLLFGAVVLLLLQAARRRQNQPRAGTYRPGQKSAQTGEQAGEQTLTPGTPQVMSRSELAGLRDAYTSARVDARQPLRCCCGCQALYQISSLAALRAENAGRCAVCSGTEFTDVRLAD